MEYRCEATSVAGFVQQLAVAYVGHGYFFYVAGEIPERKDPCEVDGRIVEKYGIAVSKATRARRKAAGIANLQYLRFKRFFLLLATHGKHEFFEAERKSIRDVREVPIRFRGYSITYRSGHPHVRIEQRLFSDLKAFFCEIAIHRSKEWLERELGALRFEPYAPVRSQLFSILRAVNARRAAAQYEAVATSCLRVRRNPVAPFARLGGEALRPDSEGDDDRQPRVEDFLRSAA